MNVIIIGPQASGKGTQAEFIAKKIGVPHISTGQLFRNEVRSGSSLGELIKPYLDRGDLVPRDLNDQVVERVLKQNERGLVLDGYPRNRHQAEFLDAHIKIDKVIVLDVPDVVCIERITGRRVCDDGHDYHVQYNPPKQDGVCDIDGLPLRKRADDEPAAIQKRLAIYHEETEPIISHYKEQGVVAVIDGRPSIEEVKKAIDNIL